MECIGTYQLGEVLGAGAWTTVYKGEHSRLPGMAAAVKVLHPHLSGLAEVRQKMRDCATTLARLRHPNIVSVLDFIEEGQAAALVVEAVEGHTLDEDLRGGARYGMRQTLSTLKALLEALGYAHGLGIVHGEFDASDVFFTASGTIKLLDFGAGAIAHGGLQDSSSAKADLIGAGHIAASMILGEPSSGQPPSANELTAAGAPSAFAEFLARLMQVHPTRSFLSCGEALAALGEVTGQRARPAAQNTLHFNTCMVDLARQQVLRPGGAQKLSATERALLIHFAKHPGVVQSRETLLREVWDMRGNVVTRAVDIAIRRLRNKIEEDPKDPTHILTVHGQGYRFEPPDDGLFQTPTGSFRKLSDMRSVPEPVLAEPSATAGKGQTDFKGRNRDMLALATHFERGAQLVVLTGPGGMGKTRCATEFAAAHLPPSLSEATPWFCDLQAVQTLEELVVAVANAVGVSMADMGSGSDVDTIGRYLAEHSPGLLILDNFEQLVELAPKTVGMWMQTAENTRFLVTSQALLDLGERIHELQPLDSDAATALFIDRAQAIRFDFSPNDTERETISKLVDALSGIPLAIELAASRIRMLSPAQLLDRMSERLDLLAARGKVDRTATLRGAIAWSMGLLSEAEQQLMVQTAVFSGGFSAESAEAILDAGDEPVLFVLQRLVDRSLLRSLPVPDLAGERRFYCFDSIGVYCRELHDKLPDVTALHDRHHAHFVEMAERFAADLESERGHAQMRRLTLETDNLLKVQRDTAQTHPEISVRVAMALDPVLSANGPAGVHARLLTEAVQIAQNTTQALVVRASIRRIRLNCDHGASTASLMSDLEATQTLAQGDPVLEASVSLTRARLVALQQGQSQENVTILESLVPVFRAHGEHLLEVEALYNLTRGHEMLGQMDVAERHARAALQIAAANGLRRSEAEIRRALGVMLCNSGRLDEAETNLKTALDIFDSFDNQRLVGVCQVIMGDICLALGRHDEVNNRLEDARRIALSLGNQPTAALALGTMGRSELDRGNTARARELLQEATSGLSQMLPALGFTRLHLGLAWLIEGQPDQAETLMVSAMDVLKPGRFEIGRCYGLLGQALVLHRLGRTEEAIPLVDEAETRGTDQEQSIQLSVQLLRHAFGLSDALDAETLRRASARSAELRVLQRALAS